jgi:hypothetical protein
MPAQVPRFGREGAGDSGGGAEELFSAEALFIPCAAPAAADIFDITRQLCANLELRRPAEGGARLLAAGSYRRLIKGEKRTAEREGS